MSLERLLDKIFKYAPPHPSKKVNLILCRRHFNRKMGDLLGLSFKPILVLIEEI